MSQRAMEFLSGWTNANVTAIAYADIDERAEALAVKCVADAAEAGISETELRAGLAGDLVNVLRYALTKATDVAIAQHSSQHDY